LKGSDGGGFRQVKARKASTLEEGGTSKRSGAGQGQGSLPDLLPNPQHHSQFPQPAITLLLRGDAAVPHGPDMGEK
jgi:hypothetical protein